MANVPVPLVFRIGFAVLLEGFAIYVTDVVSHKVPRKRRNSVHNFVSKLLFRKSGRVRGEQTHRDHG